MAETKSTTESQAAEFAVAECTTSETKFVQCCESCCFDKTKEEARTLWQGQHCRVVLRTDNQALLGRCIIVATKHIWSLDVPSHGISPEELAAIREEFSVARRWIVNTYKKAFPQMIRVNVLEIGNLTRDEKGEPTSDLHYFHVHQHVLPRYLKPQEWNGRMFEDTAYADALCINPKAPHNHPKLSLAPEELCLLVKHIRACA